MAQKATVQSVWLGQSVMEHVQIATGRGIISIAEHVVVLGKENADVITGTMRRSIHAAPANYDGANDEETAKTNDIANVSRPTERGITQIVEVGSWVPYACVEEVVRGHQFMTPAVQSVQGSTSNRIMVQAFREEGMTVKPF